jgi:hypothetical protein
MSPSFSFAALVAAVAVFSAFSAPAPAAAQSAGGLQARVAVNVQLFAPGATDDAVKATKTQEGARRTIYAVASHECAILLEQVASDCALESVNVSANLNRYNNPQQPEGFMVTGNMNFRITTK